MRQESAFDPRAASDAGAYGLLRLIAPTARRIGEQLHEPFLESSLLSLANNERYGAHYIAQLSGNFGGTWRWSQPRTTPDPTPSSVG